MRLWTDDARFIDPLTIAEGWKQYQTQFYGLKALFGRIEQLSCPVERGGNPIEMSLTTRYTLKGVGSSQVVESMVLIHISEDGGKIEKVYMYPRRWERRLDCG